MKNSQSNFVIKMGIDILLPLLFFWFLALSYKEVVASEFCRAATALVSDGKVSEQIPNSKTCGVDCIINLVRVVKQQRGIAFATSLEQERDRLGKLARSLDIDITRGLTLDELHGILEKALKESPTKTIEVKTQGYALPLEGETPAGFRRVEHLTPDDIKINPENQIAILLLDSELLPGVMGNKHFVLMVDYRKSNNGIEIDYLDPLKADKIHTASIKTEKKTPSKKTRNQSEGLRLSLSTLGKEEEEGYPRLQLPQDFYDQTLGRVPRTRIFGISTVKVGE